MAQDIRDTLNTILLQALQTGYEPPKLANPPTEQDIQRIATKSPLVHACLCLLNDKAVTWEEALMLMVVSLHQNNEALLRMSIELASVPPSVTSWPSDPAH